MAAVLTRNPNTGEDVVAPTKADGSLYRYEMIFDRQRSRAYGDTAADLIDALVPGYATLGSDEERIKARVRYATGLLAPLQASVLQQVDQTALSNAEKDVLLKPRFEAVTIDEWASEVPLVLLDVHYSPFSEIDAPVSTLEDVENPRNIIWVRAGEEYDLLMSLSNIGVITVAENSDFVV